MPSSQNKPIVQDFYLGMFFQQGWEKRLAWDCYGVMSREKKGVERAGFCSSKTQGREFPEQSSEDNSGAIKYKSQQGHNSLHFPNGLPECCYDATCYMYLFIYVG